MTGGFFGRWELTIPRQDVIQKKFAFLRALEVGRGPERKGLGVGQEAGSATFHSLDACRIPALVVFALLDFRGESP